MPDNNAAPSPQPDRHDTIVATLSQGGPRTAGQLAEHLGIPYSTLTPRLRHLEEHGRAERFKDPATRQTIWQVTATAPSSDVVTDDDLRPDTVVIDDSDRRADAAHSDADRDDARARTGTETHEPADTHHYAAIEEHDDAADRADPETPGADAHAPAPERRQKGAIPAAILEVTRAHPADTFKVSQLQKALHGASGGAIANAAAKLVVSGELLCVCEKPATYQAA